MLSVMFRQALMMTDDDKQQEEEKKEEESTDQSSNAEPTESQEVQVTQLTMFCTICDNFYFFLTDFINIVFWSRLTFLFVETTEE